MILAIDSLSFSWRLSILRSETNANIGELLHSLRIKDKADLFEIALDLYRCQIQRVRTMMMVLRRTLTAAEADVDDLKTVLQAEGQGGNRS